MKFPNVQIWNCSKAEMRAQVLSCSFASLEVGPEAEAEAPPGVRVLERRGEDDSVVLVLGETFRIRVPTRIGTCLASLELPEALGALQQLIEGNGEDDERGEDGSSDNEP